MVERTYNVPLRREWLKVPKYKRAKKASIALRQFLARHMKSDNVKIGAFLNMKVWEHGIQNPPHHVKVVAQKDSKGVVTAELEGAIKEAMPEKEKSPAEKNAEEKKPEVRSEKPAETVSQDVKKDANGPVKQLSA